MRALVALTVAGATLATGILPSQAASYPLPVKTTSGANQEMPDPGVLLYNGNFYEFSTGTGLEESTSTIAAGPWSKPINTLDMNSLPS